tara:strand:+ start:12497 stop:12802 length:306 start_codon:yes stop_codon:yes gene_type:complete
MSEEINKESITPEQAEKKRKEITDWYKKQIPHLKVQAQYENLMTEIEESRAKRMQAQAFLADAYMQLENAKEEPAKSQAGKDFESEKAAASGKERKLKVQS